MIPAWRIEQDGNDVTEKIAPYFASLSISDNIGWGSDTLTLTLNDGAGDLDIPRRGARLSAYIGYQGEELAFMGIFVVDTASIAGPPDVVTLSCRGTAFMDADLGKAWQTKKSRSFETAELGNLCATIAADHDTELAITDDAKAIVLPHIIQDAESDLALLLRLAVDYDLVVKPAVGKLIIMKRHGTATAAGSTIPTTTITPGDLGKWSFELGNRVRYNKIMTFYHDLKTGQPIEKTAGTGDVIYKHPNAFANELDASNAATAMLNAYQRGGVTFSFDLMGRTDLIADGYLTLSGFRPTLNGDQWKIETAEHKIDSGGYSLTISGTNRTVAAGADETTPDEGISDEDGNGCTDEDGREPATT